MPPDRDKDEPTTPLGEAAVSMHEQFRTLVDSGFSEWQAIRLLGVMMAELIRSR